MKADMRLARADHTEGAAGDRVVQPNVEVTAVRYVLRFNGVSNRGEGLPTDYVLASVISRHHKPEIVVKLSHQPREVAHAPGNVLIEIAAVSYYNGETLTVQKELIRHASIQTTLNTYGGGMMDSMGEAHGRVVKQAMARQWTLVDVSPSAKQLRISELMAERVGFEPTLPFRVNTLSKRAPSATRPSLRRPAK
jgi:hypothetical protein